MKIKATPDLSNVKGVEEVQRFATIVLKEIVEVLNGNVRFDDNLSANIISVNLTGSTQVAVSHGLGRVPLGYIVVKAPSALSVFDGDSENTTETLYIKSNTSAAISLLVI